ncbi:MAG: CorA family divalent cation transporter, partial [Gallionella sp.]
MLINCVAYQNGVKLADLAVDEISDYLDRNDCFVWVALRDTTDDELDQMQKEFRLHDLAVEDARHGHQRPKIEEYGDTLFVVMHLLEIDGSELSVGEISIFVERNFVLSIRNRSKQSFLGVRERCQRQPELLRLGSSFVFYALMDAVVDRYFPVIDDLESQLETIEERLFDKGGALANIAQLYELKRKVMV